MERLLLVALLGCAPAKDTVRQPGQTPTDTDTGTPPVVEPTDTTSTDETTPPPMEWQRYTLADGSVVEGEAVASYDRSLWWHPSDDVTIGVYVPGQWADYPDDASVVFLEESQVAAQEPAEGVASYFDELASRGVVVRSPLPQSAYVIQGNEGYHYEEDGYGNYAWDLVYADEYGRTYQGYGALNSDFAVWNAPVTLPVGGTVVEVVSDAPDNPPGSYPSIAAANNLVGIKLSGQFYLYLLHFRQGTIPASVVVGAELEAGTFLGNVGNSGVTLEPHLHMTVHYWSTERQRYFSVPSQFADVVVDGVAEPFAIPETGMFVANGGTR